MDAEYLIRKGGFFYRPNSQGYTPSVLEAGLFTHEEVIKLTYPNGPDGPRDELSYHHRSRYPELERALATTNRVKTLEQHLLGVLHEADWMIEKVELNHTARAAVKARLIAARKSLSIER
jgi:hypothetical protein